MDCEADLKFCCEQIIKLFCILAEQGKITEKEFEICTAEKYNYLHVIGNSSIRNKQTLLAKKEFPHFGLWVFTKIKSVI